jgi:hypothetical protein
MVIHEIDIGDVVTLEPENQPPVSRDPDGPLTRAIAFQFVQAGAGQVHIGGLCADIQRGEPSAELRGVLCVDPTGASGPVKPFKALVPEAQDRV